jgi:hypothetical protein
MGEFTWGFTRLVVLLASEKIKRGNRKFFIYPLVNIQKAIENGPVEIVDLPIKNDFP